MLGIFTYCRAGDTFDTDSGPNPGTLNTIVKPWMTGFTGFTGGDTYSCITITDEQMRMGFKDLANIIYSRGYTSTQLAMSTLEFYDKGDGTIGYRLTDNGQFTICIGY